MHNNLLRKIYAMGALRLLLFALALVIIILMPMADISLPPSGWGLLFGAALPAAAPMVFMVLMLDLMMCLILKADADVSRRHQLNFNIGMHAGVASVLVLVWLPVFLRAAYFSGG